MKALIVVFGLFTWLLSSHSVASTPADDELTLAYQKEYAYLTSEKAVLEKRLASLKATNRERLGAVRAQIEKQQQAFLRRQNDTDQLNRQIADAGREVDFADNDQLLLETTLLQAAESLSALGTPLPEQEDRFARLAQAFTLAAARIAADDDVTRAAGSFFRADGALVDGEVVSVGRIARYGIADQVAGVLAPAGDDRFKLWDETTGADAKAALSNPASMPSVPVFLYDNPGVAVERQEEKTFSKEVEAGGLIARIILGLGIVGVLLVFTRIGFLSLFGADIQKISGRVTSALQSGKSQEALQYCQGKMSSASRVMAATLRNLDKEREHIEDIISEAILYEASRIDRYGAAIIVIAAVAPLLGLLGTVTGMISTFDIITEFGTGDPKLLSSGISEALITTKYGLVVAIPLLLAGNLLSNWGTRTKNDLERAALHVLNAHQPTVRA